VAFAVGLIGSNYSALPRLVRLPDSMALNSATSSEKVTPMGICHGTGAYIRSLFGSTYALSVG